MKQFGKCLKKEYLEQWRTKKFLTFVLFAVGMALFSFLIMGLLVLFKQLGLVGEFDPTNPESSKFLTIFQGTYGNVTNFFCVFMITYFLLIMIVMQRNVIDKEIKDRKWVLPMQAGVKPSNMILAKFVAVLSTLIISTVIACLVHFIGTVIFFKPVFDGSTLSAGTVIGRMFFSYAMILITIIFFTVMTVSINALTRKGWVTVVVSFLVLMLGSQLLGFIDINGTPLSRYSPFFFYELVGNGLLLKPTSTTVWQWVISSIVTVVIMGGLIFAAVKRTSVKSVNAE